MREIVLEIEAEWAQQLGPANFAKLRDLLGQLNAIPADDSDGPDAPRA